MPLFFGSSPEVKTENFDVVVHPAKVVREDDVFINQDVRVLFKGERGCLGDNFLASGIVAYVIRISNNAANVIVLLNDGAWNGEENGIV